MILHFSVSPRLPQNRGMVREDRISALPDGILCHILSFLPTEDAITTSLLSKRWKLLWLSVPVLDLDDQTFLRYSVRYSSFFKFAYAAILSRASAHQPLTRFRFYSRTCRDNDDLPKPHFKLWVNTVVQRGLEHLHIEVPCPYGLLLGLPSSVFTCKTLVVLKLSYLTVDAPGSVNLPALKTLHLDHDFILQTRYLAELIRGCPILEDLRVNDVYILKSDVVEFQSMPKLVRAYICSDYGVQIPLNAVCNVEYLRFHVEVRFGMGHGHVIFNQERFPVFHNLIRLELSFGSYIKCHSVFEMLKHCPKLQILSLCKTSPWMQSPPDVWSCPQSVPECISSQLRKCTI